MSLSFAIILRLRSRARTIDQDAGTVAMSNGFFPRRKPTISIDPKRMGSFERIGAVPSSRGGGGGVGRLRDLLLSSSSSWSWGHFSHHDGKGSRSVALLAAALVVTVLVCFGMFARGGGDGEPRHVVVFDAGSTGNRVHVFEFDTSGRDGPRLKREVFHAEKPGLKERAEDPRAAAALLDPLVATAMRSVPARARKRTPLTLRATAGLRLLPEGPAAADAIMDAVRSKLARTGFDVKSRDVSILSGDDEGLYGWVAVNYLLGRIGGGGDGRTGKNTVALADLGGGSAQLSYAVDADVASAAPAGYVRTVPGTRGPAGPSSAYVHSFNGYGLVAARHRILAVGGAGEAKAGEAKAGETPVASGKGTRAPPSRARTHACIHAGHAGHSCDRDCYGLDDPTTSYSVTPAEAGGSFEGCVRAATNALDADEECEHAPCSFGGAWRAARATGVTEFYAMSYIAERAVQCGAADAPADDATPTTTTPRRLAAAGADACATRVDRLGAKYPNVEEEHRPWLCADVAYVYALLTRGFGVGEDETVTLVDKIAYRGEAVEAAWALGDAIAVMEGGRGGEGGDGVVTERSRAR